MKLTSIKTEQNESEVCQCIRGTILLNGVLLRLAILLGSQLYLSRRGSLNILSTLHGATVSAAEPQDERPNTWIFSPQDSFFRNTHGYPAKDSCSNTQRAQSDALAQVTISSSARYKACGQEETSAERSRISRTALVIDAPVCQTSSPLWIPNSYHRQLNSFSVAVFLRLRIFGRALKDQLLLFHSDVKSRNIGGSCRRSNWAAGMSAGDQNSALNFKCHCTKSGDTEWGVNWPSQ